MKLGEPIAKTVVALGVGLGALLGVSLSACQTTRYEDHGLVFEPHEVVTGDANSQTILPGFFLGRDMADLAVVSVDRRHYRRVQIYALEEGSWKAVVDAPLGHGVVFVDVATVGERDRLLTYEGDRVSFFDPDSAEEHVLARFAAGCRPEDPGRVPRVDVSRDLNGDGRDDLVLPAVDGFWISTQAEDGSFAEAVKLGPREPFFDQRAYGDERTYGEVGVTTMTLPWYLSRVRGLDYDQDGRRDLVFWNEDRFDVHLQGADGSFDPQPRSFTTDVPFDSDGVYSHIFGYTDRGMLSLLLGIGEKMKRTVLHSLRDLNGDGVADLVTHSLEGRTPLKQRSRLKVHPGAATPDGLRFARKASTIIQPRGKVGGQSWGYASLATHDFNGDGQTDFMLRRVNMGLTKMFRAMLANSITLDLEFYRIEDGVYPEEPKATRKVRPAMKVFSKRGPFFPLALMGDVNGDGLSDLLVGQGWEELQVFVGVPGPDLFSENPQKLEVCLPNDERNAWLMDLNQDAKQDLLVYHSSEDPHRLTVLIAQ